MLHLINIPKESGFYGMCYICPQKCELKYVCFLKSKSKRPEVVDSDDEKMDNQQKKRRRIKKPQPDSSDDEGTKEIGGKQEEEK